MTDIKYHIIKPDDNESIELIADWYGIPNKKWTKI
jgi:hypothetical protein